MENIKIGRTENTPAIDFNFVDNQFAIRGESYPEDVPSFFGPVLSALEKHLKEMSSGKVEFNFELVYFNSTSAKVVMRLFDLLDRTAGHGVDVVINWHFQADDDNMQELGEEFSEDLESATFNMCPVSE